MAHDCNEELGSACETLLGWIAQNPTTLTLVLNQSATVRLSEILKRFGARVIADDVAGVTDLTLTMAHSEPGALGNKDVDSNALNPAWPNLPNHFAGDVAF